MNRLFRCLFLIWVCGNGVRAEPVYVAVAANFADTARQLGERFHRTHGIDVQISSASSGQIYAQITNGAPFDVFLSADQRFTQQLEQQGLVEPGSRYIYAVGYLVLWSALPSNGSAPPLDAAYLTARRFKRLAMANPKVAPYGVAAQSVLERLGLWSSLQSEIIRAENVQQVLQFVATGNVQAGFVALAQVRQFGASADSYWRVPVEWYAPLNQDAVLLSRARNKIAAQEFFRYLKSAEARLVIEQAGYGLVDLPVP